MALIFPIILIVQLMILIDESIILYYALNDQSACSKSDSFSRGNIM